MLLLVFRLGDDRFALDAGRIAEVVPLVIIKQALGAPAGICGTFNYRGRFVAAVGLSERILGRPAKQRLGTRVVLATIAGESGPRLLGLTGLSNRRYFNEDIEAEWNRALRTRAPLSMLMIDVDRFKQYNDSSGHLAGDEVLKKVAGAIEAGCKRSADLAARYGGEEFAAVLPVTSASDLPLLADKLRRAVEGLQLAHRASTAGPFVTISIGGATLIPEMSHVSAALIAAADQALYRAKHAGRNRAAFSEA